MALSHNESPFHIESTVGQSFHIESFLMIGRGDVLASEVAGALDLRGRRGGCALSADGWRSRRAGSAHAEAGTAGEAATAGKSRPTT
jgi:hypothetical protein